MARSSDNLVLKKNTKLESFLKRALSDETYERIRAHESCIVVSEKDSKAFKYVILSDEWVYLTENPPKVIQEAVPLKDVTSVELVNDFPDFLSGSERENTQHLAITYLTSDPQKRRSFRWKSSRSPRGSIADSVSIDRSNTSTPLGYAESVDSFSEDFGYNTQSTTSLHLSSRPNSRSSSVSGSRELRSNSTKKKKKQATDTVDPDSILRALKEEIEEDHVLEDIEEDRLSTIHHTTNSFGGGQDSSRRMSAVSTQQGALRPLPTLPKTPKTQAFEKSVEPKENSKAPLVVEPSTSPDACACPGFLCCASRNVVSPAAVNSCRKSLPVKLAGAAVMKPPDIEVEEEDSRRASIATIQPVPSATLATPITYPPPSRSSRLSTPLIDLERPRPGSGLGSSLDLQGSMNGLQLLDGGAEPRRKAVLNIYLLSISSPMLMLIRSAWSNYLIRSTLCLDPLYKYTRSSIVRKSQTQREKTELLYGQLKRELLNHTNRMEENYQLLNELRLATEKNFLLKKLFWRSSDVFLFLVRNMQRYLPRSAHNINTEIGRQQRADEMEFVILLTEILSLMFRESEIIHTRIQTLKAERGKAVLDLLMALTCTPELPEKSAPSRRPTSQSARMDEKRPTDEDFSKIMSDFTNRAITTVFELFLMARQANWGNTEGNFFNISWMVKVLEEIRTTEKFLERVMDQLLGLISGGGCLLSPQESVTMYQYFSVINTFLEFSPRLTNFITNTYQEEFKYFLQAPLISRKLPSNYPITPLTLKLVEQVVAKVLRSTDARSSRSPRQAY